MNEALQKWLAARARTPGFLGIGIRLPDGTCLGQAADEHFSNEKIEKILQQAVTAQLQLLDANLPVRWSTWIFEQGKIRLIARPDNLVFALLVRNDTDAALDLDLFSRESLMLEFNP